MANSNFSDFDQKLKQVNFRLKGANNRVTLERKGSSLYARATLPPPPNSDKTAPHQQYLSLRVKATPEGLKRAEAEAKKIGAALDLKEFDWADYAQIKNKADDQTVAGLIELFELNYFENKKRSPKTEKSFKGNWLCYLKQLPPGKTLTRKILEQAIKATTPNSHQRSRICSVFKRFGIFAEVDVEFIDKDLRGTYSSSKAAPRDLPPDELIVQWFNQIPNPRWRWVYAILAAYGLRPHEVFHLDTQELEQGGYVLKVLDETKTGYREVRPLYPEWIEQFGLRHKQLPNVTGKTNSDLGRRVSQAFRRYKTPFPPYNLRHCYAVRCLEFDINVSLAALWMGHSVSIHTKVYQAWLSKAVEERAFQRALNNPNRPQPPIVQTLEQPEGRQAEAA